MEYEVVFDVLDAGYTQWWFPACGLIGLGIGIAIIVIRRLLRRAGFCLPRTGQGTIRSYWDEWGPYFLPVFAAVWTTILFVSTFRDYWNLRQRMLTGRYEVVEGTVTNFVPMPDVGGDVNESFVVNGHRYKYSDYQASAGFHNTQLHGGPMREGLHVRIADVDGRIARLEIERH